MLGGSNPFIPQYGYEGQIAEVMVFNRSLTLDEGRSVTGSLRRKYRLDVLDALLPADTYLMQAEDFDGPWEVRSRWHPWVNASQGYRYVIASGKAATDGIKRPLAIAHGRASIRFGYERCKTERTRLFKPPCMVKHCPLPITKAPMA